VGIPFGGGESNGPSILGKNQKGPKWHNMGTLKKDSIQVRKKKPEPRGVKTLCGGKKRATTRGQKIALGGEISGFYERGHKPKQQRSVGVIGKEKNETNRGWDGEHLNETEKRVKLGGGGLGIFKQIRTGIIPTGVVNRSGGSPYGEKR